VDFSYLVNMDKDPLRLNGSILQSKEINRGFCLPLEKQSPTISINIHANSNRSSNPSSNKNPKVLLKINRGHADMAIFMGAPRCVVAPFPPHSVQDLYTPHSNYIISPWSSLRALCKISCRNPKISKDRNINVFWQWHSLSTRVEVGNGKSDEFDYDLCTIGARSSGVRTSRFATNFYAKAH
jgi:hypothetical protein